MAKTSSLKSKLVADFPAIQFEASDDFYWSPLTTTVYHGPLRSQHDKQILLHETAHALLDHLEFTRDIDLLRIEREAWDYAQTTLAPRYDVEIDEDTVESMVDTYREWLHARSRCPHCSLTGIQTDGTTYHCLGCNQNWRVNEARRCGLKRYSLSH